MTCRSKEPGARVAIDVIRVLADCGRATVYKLHDEIVCRSQTPNRTLETVRLAVKLLYREGLIEKAGRVPRPPHQHRGCGPTIWKLHKRLGYVL
jgi:hypothetical protein